jgi:hypothetical protein
MFQCSCAKQALLNRFEIRLSRHVDNRLIRVGHLATKKIFVEIHFRLR